MLANKVQYFEGDEIDALILCMHNTCSTQLASCLTGTKDLMLANVTGKGFVCDLGQSLLTTPPSIILAYPAYQG